MQKSFHQNAVPVQYPLPLLNDFQRLIEIQSVLAASINFKPIFMKSKRIFLDFFI